MTFSRRAFIGRVPLLAGACMATRPLPAASTVAAGRQSEPFRYCLNTATLRGQKLGLVQEIEIIAKAGYGGIEPWVREIDQYVQQGGALEDLRKRIADHGLTVEGVIGFAPWMVDDAARRGQAMEEMKRMMGTVRALGGQRVAAPPAGEGSQPVKLRAITDRYRDLLELGRRMDAVPQLEIWGFSRSLHRLGQVAFVAVETGHPGACLLLDVYHIYRGGSDFAGLQVISGHAMHVFHVNDYPASPSRESLRDADRVYPGDGVAPLPQILGDLHAGGFRGTLSVELFNPTYWRQDPLLVARAALAKTVALVQKCLAS